MPGRTGGRYTTRAYWEAYYRQAATERGLVERMAGRYDALWEQLYQAAARRPRSALEIGGYPGRYLAYFSRQYGLEPACLDFNSDREKVKEAFEAFGLEEGRIIQADLLVYEPDQQYDIVYSLGLVEHFEDVQGVLDRHLAWLRPGGAMLIMVPNKRYLRRWYGLLLDRDNLELHNLGCMRKDVFRRFATRHGLQVRALAYWGPFPYKVHQRLNAAQKLIYHAVRQVSKLTAGLQERHPSRWYSAGLYAIFQKPL